MNDILPDQIYLWEFFEQVVRDWMAAYGYRNIRMPIVEQTDLFVRSIGAVTDIVEKEMYTFLDHLNGESLTLRPEGTASCVRAALEHNLLYAGPAAIVLFGADVSSRAAAKRSLPPVPSGRGRSAGLRRPGHRCRTHRDVRGVMEEIRYFRCAPGDRHAWQYRVPRTASAPLDSIS